MKMNFLDKLRSISLLTKLVVIFIFFGLMIISLATAFFVYQGEKSLSNRIASQFESVAVLKENQLNQFVESVMFLMNVMSKDVVVHEYMDGPKDDKANEIIVANTAHKLKHTEITEVTLLSLDGLVEFSTNSEQIGKSKSKEDYFAKGLEKPFITSIFFEESSDLPAMISATPIVNKAGKKLGVIVLRINMKNIDALMAERSGLGETGETYLVNEQQYAVSELRNQTDSVRAEIKEYQFEDCLVDNKDFGKYNNYAGQDVVGLRRPIEKRNLCLLIEMNQEEAFASIKILKDYINIMRLALVALGAVVGVLLAKSITKPVMKLKDAAMSIGEGKLDTHIEIKAGDEIQDLANTFKQMASSLSSQIHITKKEQARLVASINNLPLGFVLIDNQSNILLSNPAVEKILDLKADEWSVEDVNKKLGSKINLIDICKETGKTKKITEIKEFELGTKGFLRILVAPVVMVKENDQIIGSVVLFEDITEAKLLNQTRDEFFAVAAHELRTPLTCIRGNVSLIQDFFGDKIKDKNIKNMLEDIHSSSVRLIGVVQDFLDVSILEQKKITFNKEEFSVLPLIEQAMRESKKMASTKKLSVKLEKSVGSLPYVVADKDRTKQIIGNLLGNAIKFTKKGGAVVKVGSESGKVKISITDTGVGIAPEGQKMLFRKFTQTGDNPLTRDTTQGTGLGLYISKMLAEGMKGKVELEKTQLGKGSTFTITLPASKKNKK